ncbi:hypothetical protein SAMN04487912_11024 [Arthrobacter sp. cf158]|uniref:hypothetical protein n=1 Tax=Arthrobacter sp. cf158 TaxID=1761744 RepID=UPI00089C56AC|nr:hypothetical protein [Arthrobacter sp. cf158]SDX31029.1 hypothetical protein SAMN04487912_11024 [Arthrobacter sp. cf158]
MRSTNSPQATPADWSLALDLSTRINNRHGGSLHQFREALTPSARSQDLGHRGRRQHRLGPLPSFDDENVSLTIVAETVELGWFAVGPAPEGTCLTVSMAAHRKDTGHPAALPLAECDAWMQALLGGPWMAHAYRCECATGAASERVVSYRLFLDQNHKPVAKPQEVLAEACHPLQAS